MNTNIKPLKDGEFGVSLKEDVETVKHLPKEEVEIFSTWVKAKWTRASMPVSDNKLGTLKHLGFIGEINVKGYGSDWKDDVDPLTVLNDVDDATLEVLLKNNVITKDLHEYFVQNQVDEITFMKPFIK
jgi:hypothetical protein